MIKNKLIVDFILNIISVLIPIFILQIIIMPQLAKTLGDEKYGLIITIISLFTVISQPFGVALNNTRLLKDIEYLKRNVQGDFNILLIIFLIINMALIIIGSFKYINNIMFIELLSIIIISLFILSREYLIVDFRLKLNYRAILLNNILCAFGYIIGYVIFLITNKWEFIYLCGLLFSIIYIICKTNLLKEKLNYTFLFKSTSISVLILLIASILGTLINYIDKLILYPIMGSATVAIYYVATIFGKLITQLITPINNVLLSHLVKKEEIKNTRFIIFIGMITIVGFIGYLITLVLCKPFLYFVYPDLAYEALKYVGIATVSAIISMISSTINSFILRFLDMKWQVLINFLNLVIYLFLVFFLYKSFDFIGFFYAILLSNIIKFIYMLIIYFNKTINKKESKYY